MFKKIAIIGIGNTLRRDDGIGIIILESLLKFYRREGLDYFNFGIASFDLIQLLSSYDLALIIDGINAGLSPGELKICKLEDLDYSLDAPLSSTHELNLKSVFELSKKLSIKTVIYVAGIQVEDVSFKEGLSDRLKDKKEDILKKISVFIDTNLQ